MGQLNSENLPGIAKMLLVLVPVVVIAIVKVLADLKKKRAMNTTKDFEVSDSQKAKEDIESKDTSARKAADSVDSWAEKQRKQNEKENENE